MNIELKNWNLSLQLTHHERYVAVQAAATGYDLCFRLRGDHYHVPYITLPILLKACKSLGYDVTFSKELLEFHKNIQTTRKNLEWIKTAKITDLQNYPPFQRIWAFLASWESDKGFTLSDGQKRSIIYGIIGKSILIGNGVGTGKTLVANLIAKFLIMENQVNKVLILVPANLVKNYHNDYIKFFGKTGVMKIGKETKEKRKEMYKIFNSTKSFNFLITNYEKCLFDFEELQTLKPDLIVVDEFHRMKNFFDAKRSINFFELLDKFWDCKFRLPMSGTPIENKLFDLFPIFKLLDGGKLLGGQRFFDNNFVEYKDVFFKVFYGGKYHTKIEQKPIGFKNLEFLKNIIRPNIIQERLQLPVGKYVEYIEIEPTKKFIEAYNVVRMNSDSTSQRYHDSRQFLNDTTRGNIADNPKFEYLDEILTQNEDKIVVFSFYHCSVSAISKFLDNKNIKYYSITGKDNCDPSVTIEQFANDPNCRVLICTDCVNAGQNGMTVARWLIHWDIPLKPSVSLQREGRVYRTGQSQDVHVRYLITMGTVEEQIYKAYQDKMEIIENALNTLDDKKIGAIESEIEKQAMKHFA
jgi:non-specific serine/threonine protein kinase